jgi:hypothetical protein
MLKTAGGSPAFPSDAITEGRLAEVRAYLAAGGDIDARPPGAMYSLLAEAVTCGNEKLVKELLTKGANPNALSATKTSPLQEAAELGLDGVVEALLGHGALASYRDPGGRTALHAAALCCRVPGKSEWRRLPPPKKGRVIELLLRSGVDPLQKDNGGRTARFFLHDCPNREGLDLLPEDDASARRPDEEPAESPEDLARAQAEEEKAFRAFLARTTRALKSARHDENELVTAITTYLEEGDALGCSPAELWDHFAVSTPSLPERARLTQAQAALARQLFERLTKQRYQG